MGREAAHARRDVLLVADVGQNGIEERRVREIEERLRPSRDQVERQMVRAPVDGEIMALRVAAVGDVIGPREPILDILPSNEKLVVEAMRVGAGLNEVQQAVEDTCTELRGLKVVSNDR